ncbi:hypothetical protein ACR6C2_08590 [Streptomyces sp. INA 01156]
MIYRAQQKQGAMITQMRAEATAQKIAALTQRQQPLPEESEAPEPVRRKRHLGYTSVAVSSQSSPRSAGDCAAQSPGPPQGRRSHRDRCCPRRYRYGIDHGR